MTLGEMVAADLRAMIADVPIRFTYDGLEYIGTTSGKNLRRPLEIGGFQDTPEVTLVIPIKTVEGAPTFTEAPSVGDPILIGAHTYRVERTELDEFSEALQLDLISPHQ